jgi:hypothetical protein
MLTKLPNAAVREQINEAYLFAQKLDYDSDFVLENDREGYADLYDFANWLAYTVTDTVIANAAQELRMALDTSDFIVAEGHSSGLWHLDDVHGVSIYLPFGEELYIGDQCTITVTDPCESTDAPSCIKVRDFYTTTVSPKSQHLSFAQDTAWDEFVNEFIDIHYCDQKHNGVIQLPSMEVSLQGQGSTQKSFLLQQGQGLLPTRQVSIRTEPREGNLRVHHLVYLPIITKSY